MFSEINEIHKEFLSGKHGKTLQKAAMILDGIADSFGTDKFINVTSVQISGVSYMNLGEAGLKFLRRTAESGKVRVKTTLNPSAVDYDNPQDFISKEFIKKQNEVIKAYVALGVTPVLSCTPYFSGNLPLKGEHIAWAESSAVVYANSVIGAMTNREGGPAALASALTGYTPFYGMHLKQNRAPKIKINIKTTLDDPLYWGLLGAWSGRNFKDTVPLIETDENVDESKLQALSAALITYGGPPLFHLKHITPEWNDFPLPVRTEEFNKYDLDEIYAEISDELAPDEPVDMYFIGCPHISASYLQLIDSENKNSNLHAAVAGNINTENIQNLNVMKGTCIAVSPLPSHVKTIVTDSTKAAFYLKNRGYKVICKPRKECLI